MPRSVTSFLDIAGIVCIVAAGALVAPALGLALLGAGCLALSWAVQR